MASRGHRRQYTRHAIDLGVTIAIAEESAGQVTPINGLKGARPTAGFERRRRAHRVADISAARDFG